MEYSTMEAVRRSGLLALIEDEISGLTKLEAAVGSSMLQLLELPPLKLSKVGDTNQADWIEYMKSFSRNLADIKDVGIHTAGHICCRGCLIARNIIFMIGQNEIGT